MKQSQGKVIAILIPPLSNSLPPGEGELAYLTALSLDGASLST